jgi:hypothetical protein
MPRFIVTRTLPPLNEEQLQAVGKNVISACDELGMEWIRSHVTADGKHSYCEFEAPNGDTCREHASRAGLPVDDVIAVGMELGPEQFK